MSFEDDFYRRKLGKSFEEHTRGRTHEDFQKRKYKEILSNYPTQVLSLGYSQHEEEFLSREDKDNHCHIIGATQQGKSRLLTHLITHDLKHGYPACLIDGGENGSTAQAVLRWCIAHKFKKVCLINPIDFLEYGRIPNIQPIDYGSPARLSAGAMMTAFAVLWDTADTTNTPRIKKYVPALIHALHAARMTLPEALFFFSPQFVNERKAILDRLDYYDPSRKTLEDVFRPPTTIFESFQSSVNRLMVVQDDLIRLMLGSNQKTIPWSTLIYDGWLILLNLDHQEVWNEDIPAKLIGTLVISEIFHTIHRIHRTRNWDKRFYLYIDEVGKFATYNLSEILDYKSKLGLKLTVAHQRFEHIKDKQVASAIETNAHNKFLFYTSNADDRRRMMRAMHYGGDIPDRQIEYVLGDAQKQEAFIRIGKRSPVKIKMVDVPDINIDLDKIIAFKKELYSYEWFHDPNVINNEIFERITTAKAAYTQQGTDDASQRASVRKAAPRTNQVLVEHRAKDDSRATSKPRQGPPTEIRIKTIFGKEYSATEIGKLKKNLRPPQPNEGSVNS